MTIVRVRCAGRWEAEIHVEPRWGDAASIARRLRGDGLHARRKGAEVHVDAPAGVTGEDTLSLATTPAA